MKFIKEIRLFFNKVSADNIGVYTAQCAYFSFLSFIPFIILLLSLTKYININYDTFEYILESIFPVTAKNTVLNIIQEVYSKSIRNNFYISFIYTLVCSK